MSTLSDILSSLASGGASTAQPKPATPMSPNYVPEDAVTQQYNLANQLRRVAPATSWAGVAAQGLGAIGGNLVQGDANNALAANQALRKSDIANAANATDLPSLEKSLITAQTPDIQNLGLKTKIQQITDDPSKEYRVRAAQAVQYGMKPGNQDFRDFVLTGKIKEADPTGMFGKQGAVFQGADGGFYTIQFGGDGTRRILPVTAPGGGALTPAKGVEAVGDELVNKATGGTVRNVASQLEGGASAKKTGELNAEGANGLPKANIALQGYEANNKVVSDSIDKAIGQANGWTTGFMGSTMSHVPGSAANDLRNTLTTIKANLGFDKLAEIRAQSPTGGALGAVSDQEGDQLRAAWGSVEQSQSQEQLVGNLQKVQQIRENFGALKRKAYEQDVARFGAANVPNPSTGKLPSSGSADPLQKARDAIAKGADRNAVIQRLRENGIDTSGL